MTDVTQIAVNMADRRDRVAARGRALGYALFSDLMASPGSDPLAALPPEDLTQALRAVEEAVPFALDFGALELAADALDDQDAVHLHTDYGTLFEAGGGTFGIREEIARNMASGAKEEVVRFYDYFGYTVRDGDAWQPDHLAIELEFLHVLCAREADLEARQSILRAQHDFLARHPGDWWPHLTMKKLAGRSLHPYHSTLFEALETYLDADLAWRRDTLQAQETGTE